MWYLIVSIPDLCTLTHFNKIDVIEAFRFISKYLDDLLNIDNSYFEQMVGQEYPTELQVK